MSRDAYQKTAELLNENIARASEGLKVDQLHDYHNCHYCKRYRRELDGTRDGVCGRCPVHKLGERLFGAGLKANGCYRVPSYRAVMKESLLLSHIRTRNPNTFIRLAHEMLQDMAKYEKEIA